MIGFNIASIYLSSDLKLWWRTCLQEDEIAGRPRIVACVGLRVILILYFEWFLQKLKMAKIKNSRKNERTPDMFLL